MLQTIFETELQDLETCVLAAAKDEGISIKKLEQSGSDVRPTYEFCGVILKFNIVAEPRDNCIGFLCAPTYPTEQTHPFDLFAIQATRFAMEKSTGNFGDSTLGQAFDFKLPRAPEACTAELRRYFRIHNGANKAFNNYIDSLKAVARLQGKEPKPVFEE